MLKNSDPEATLFKAQAINTVVIHKTCSEFYFQNQSLCESVNFNKISTIVEFIQNYQTCCVSFFGRGKNKVSNFRLDAGGNFADLSMNPSEWPTNNGFFGYRYEYL